MYCLNDWDHGLMQLSKVLGKQLCQSPSRVEGNINSFPSV